MTFFEWFHRWGGTLIALLFFSMFVLCFLSMIFGGGNRDGGSWHSHFGCWNDSSVRRQTGYSEEVTELRRTVDELQKELKEIKGSKPK